jgi:hypothetical protein
MNGPIREVTLANQQRVMVWATFVMGSVLLVACADGGAENPSSPLSLDATVRDEALESRAYQIHAPEQLHHAVVGSALEHRVAHVAVELGP